MIGPYQIPVSNIGITASNIGAKNGQVLTMGERPQIAITNPEASAEISLGEVITNIASAYIKDLSNIKLSANWMASSSNKNEVEALYLTVKKLSELCQHLNITIPVGKDSLSMNTSWSDKRSTKMVESPVSLILSAFWQVLEQSIESFPFADDLNWVWSLTTILVSLLLTFITFSLFYRFAPNRRIFLRHIWPAALIAAIAFEIMKYAFGVYLSNFGNYDLVYGALGGVVVLLYWVFLSANIFILGAEIANQIPRVLHDQPRRDHIVTTGQDNTSPWRLTRNFLIGLLLDPRDIPRRSTTPSQREKQND